MTAHFSVRVTHFEDLAEIEGSWTEADFRDLLTAMEFDDSASVAEADLREMCVMSLQDRQPAEAAAILLQHKLGDALSKGQIQNLSHEMVEEELWQEYPDMRLQERLFHVASLLHQAFDRSVPRAEAAMVRLEVRANDVTAERAMAAGLHESLLVRLLADGMPRTASLHRMFGEAIGGARFPEAESIVWIVSVEPLDARRANLRVVGSGSWLDPLRETASFESSAKGDSPA